MSLKDFFSKGHYILYELSLIILMIIPLVFFLLFAQDKVYSLYKLFFMILFILLLIFEVCLIVLFFIHIVIFFDYKFRDLSSKEYEIDYVQIIKSVGIFIVGIISVILAFNGSSLLAIGFYSIDGLFPCLFCIFLGGGLVITTLLIGYVIKSIIKTILFIIGSVLFLAGLIRLGGNLLALCINCTSNFLATILFLSGGVLLYFAYILHKNKEV